MSGLMKCQGFIQGKIFGGYGNVLDDWEVDVLDCTLILKLICTLQGQTLGENVLHRE